MPSHLFASGEDSHSNCSMQGTKPKLEFCHEHYRGLQCRQVQSQTYSVLPIFVDPSIHVSIQGTDRGGGGAGCLGGTLPGHVHHHYTRFKLIPPVFSSDANNCWAWEYTKYPLTLEM